MKNILLKVLPPEREESFTGALPFNSFFCFVGETMTPQQDRYCPKLKCEGAMVLKGEWRRIDDARTFELLLACVSCGHEEWQKFSEPSLQVE